MSDLISVLASETGLSRADVRHVARTAPRRYKVYEIPKKTGGKREIAQPARELKILQRALIARYLDALPIHPSAKAYRMGLSLRDNVLPHRGSSPILKLDFSDFFPSIHSVDWLRYCRENSLFGTEEDKDLSAHILFRRAKQERTLKLSIGAPSSPILSNILMFRFDDIVWRQAERRGIEYSRYADDMTFSGQRFGMLRDMIGVVNAAVKEARGPRLKLNIEKTTFVSAKYSRRVTGLVLANDGSIGIGREKRRLVRASIHHLLSGKLSPTEAKSLAGYLAYLKSVEPDFLVSLNEHYKTDVLKAALGRGQS